MICISITWKKNIMNKKKIFSIFCIMLFLIMTFIPMICAKETIEIPTPIFDKMALAHIKIYGNGSSLIIASEFVLGFGRCAFMRFKLDESSNIEINKFLDKTNQVVLDSNHVVTIFGFVG